MQRDQESRKLVVVSLVAAFVIGVVFGAFGTRLRPRVVLAPDAPSEPDDMAENVPPPSVTPEDVDPGSESPDSVPGDGTPHVPDGYPIKGNKRSGLYHVPGGLAYERTVADVHFRSPEAAETAGFRASKA